MAAGADDPPAPSHGGAAAAGSASSTGQPRRWRDAQGEHIDVRGLPPPQPLVAILRLIHECAEHSGAAVIAHLERDPRALYPELAEIGWTAVPLPSDAGGVVLRLQRAP
jgi:Uncharacterized conserved protein (DUF2249)